MKSKKRAVLAFAAVICAMHMYNSIRVKHNFLKCALVRPSVSPWAKLLSCGDESSFLMLTGFNYTSFRLLVSSIFTDDERFGPRGKGRPHALDFNGRMGLCLFFLGSRMRLKHLSMLFGVTPATASDEINVVLPKLLGELRRNKQSRIRWPKPEKMV